MSIFSLFPLIVYSLHPLHVFPTSLQYHPTCGHWHPIKIGDWGCIKFNVKYIIDRTTTKTFICYWLTHSNYKGIPKKCLFIYIWNTLAQLSPGIFFIYFFYISGSATLKIASCYQVIKISFLMKITFFRLIPNQQLGSIWSKKYSWKIRRNLKQYSV